MSANLFASYLTSAGGESAADPRAATVFTSAGAGTGPAGGTIFLGHDMIGQSGSSPLMVTSPLLAAAGGGGSSSVTSSSGSFPSSLSASSTPICIGGASALAQKSATATANAADALRIISSGGGSVGTDAETATAGGSAASSFSANLSNLYVGSLPENLLLPFLCQQQLQMQQQSQQQQSQQQFISNLSKSSSSTFGGLSAQAIATTVQSLLAGGGGVTAASTTAPSSATATSAASSSVDMDLSAEDRNAEQLTNQMQFVFRNHLASTGNESGPALGTSLPSMSLLLNNFISNNVQNNNNGHVSSSNNNLQMDTGLAENVIESLKLEQTSSQRSTADGCVVDRATTSSRATSESSTAGEEAAGSAGNSVVAAFATGRKSSASLLMTGSVGAVPPAVEQLRADALPGQRAAGERSGSPLKMRSRLNSRNKGVERSTTPPGGQSQADEEQSNICSVCGDEASGRHYGAATCFGCKGFFRRTVRANKSYSCRYEERCAIDKLGRNTCRSCRFRKCLNVGMEPDAIRPDRDKTGRQKNPRRQSFALPNNPMAGEAATAIRDAASSLPSSHDLGALIQPLTDDETTPNAAGATGIACFAYGRCNDGGHGASDDAAMVAERDLIIDTLLEIERICASLRADPSAAAEQAPVDFDDTGRGMTCSCADNPTIFRADLSQIIMRPSFIFNRTSLDFTGQRGSIQQSGAECCTRRHFQSAFCRLITLSIDFANTLKPIADISIQQRENLVRSCIAPYMVFLCAYRTVASGRSNCVLLPDGCFVDVHTPLSAFVDPDGLGAEVADALHSKIKFILKWVIDSVESKMEKLHMTEVEFVCLKAIIALDPSAPAVDAPVTQLLSVARDSVQNALFFYLADRHSAQQAVFRFGQLLMMISNVSKIGVFIHNAMEMIASVRNDLADAASLRLFTGLDRMSAGFSSLAGHNKNEKMSDDSEDDDDDEMDDMDANEQE